MEIPRLSAVMSAYAHHHNRVAEARTDEERMAAYMAAFAIFEHNIVDFDTDAGRQFLGALGAISPEHQLWSLAFRMGSVLLFSHQIEREKAVEGAIHWLKRALETNIAKISQVDCARTHGEIATAYKNRLSGDAADNRRKAMDHLETAIAIFVDAGSLTEWLLTVKQRAVLRLSSGTEDQSASLQEIERAIAELEIVRDTLNAESDPVLWADTMIALATTYSGRRLGHSSANIEKSAELLEDLMTRFGSLQAAIEAPDFQLAFRIAGYQTNLATVLVQKLSGDHRENLIRAKELLEEAHGFVARTSQVDVAQSIETNMKMVESMLHSTVTSS